MMVALFLLPSASKYWDPGNNVVIKISPSTDTWSLLNYEHIGLSNHK